MANAERAKNRHPRRNRRNDVYVAYCRRDETNGQFSDCMTDTILADRDDGHRILKRASLVTGPRIAAARNDLVRSFFNNSDAEWLWMVDDDQPFHYNTFRRAVDILDEHPEIKFLSALTFIGGRQHDIRPSLYQRDGLDAEGFIPLMEYPKDALVKVGGTGAFWKFVHRDVYRDVFNEHRELAHPWYDETQAKGQRQTGEDLVFCQRVHEAGYEIYVHTGLQVGHMKMMPITEWMFEQQQALTPEQLAESRLAHQRGMGMLP